MVGEGRRGQGLSEEEEKEEEEEEEEEEVAVVVVRILHRGREDVCGKRGGSIFRERKST